MCDGLDNDCDGEIDETICDDNNTCTVDSCTPASEGEAAGCKHAKKTGPCDADGTVCTEADACKDGVCTAGPAKVCDDGNACTTTACDAKLGCTNKPDDGSPCDDGNPCTKVETCKNGACTASADGFKACVSTNTCQLGQCDQNTGGCKYIDKPDGAGCDDGDACSSADACKSSVCFGKVVVCDDSNPCTTDSCKPAVGCVFQPKAGACDDGNPCSLNDSCAAGVCKGAGTKDCDDGNVCTEDACLASKGCTHLPKSGAAKPGVSDCDDGDSCTAPDQCSKGTCQGKLVCVLCNNDTECAKADDGNPCNGVLFCDQGLKPAVCQPKPGSVVKCDASGNTPCLQNTCNQQSGTCSGLVAVNDGKVCSDNDACTTSDTCKNGGCAGNKLACDDKNGCTVDSCDAKTGCSHQLATGGCDDGDPCTVTDLCAKGVCEPGQAKVCDDGKPCTKDTCKAGVGCTVSYATGAVCDDGSACTTGDACAQGECKGAAKDCDDKKACTVDTCDAKTGCKNTATTAPCDDGNACTTGDACNNGACSPGKPLSCDDGQVCTADSCDLKAGCVNKPTPGVCDDGNACTKNDACAQGKCSGEGQQCSDGNPCTTDGCTTQGGCKYTPNSASCDDGNACTLNDSCGGGSCQGGASKNCDYLNKPCNVGVCVGNGTCTTKIASGSCSDGDGCTQGDACSGGVCQSGGQKSCNDGNPCTNDSCAQGSCKYAANSYSCSDGDSCTQGDKCSNGSCQSGAVKACDDGNPCTKDYCSSGSCKTSSLSKGTFCGSGKECNGSGACVSACGTVCATKCGSVSGCNCGSCETFVDGTQAKLYSGGSQVSVNGTCSKYTSAGWKNGTGANGINVRWTWASACKVPWSSSDPLSYPGENARWSIYVSKTGYYRLEAKVPSTGYVCTSGGKSPTVRYASGVYYGLARSGQSGMFFGGLNPDGVKGGWMQISSSVYLKAGTQTLVLYDRGSTASKCATASDPTVTRWVFVDSVRATFKN